MSLEKKIEEKLSVSLKSKDKEELTIKVKKTKGTKCPRCWKILESKCVRCEKAITENV